MQKKERDVMVSIRFHLHRRVHLSSLSPIYLRRRFRPHVAPRATMARKSPQNQARREADQKRPAQRDIPLSRAGCSSGTPATALFRFAAPTGDEAMRYAIAAAGENGRDEQRKAALFSAAVHLRRRILSRSAPMTIKHAHGARGNLPSLWFPTPSASVEIRQSAQGVTTGQHDECDNEQDAAHRYRKERRRAPSPKCDEDRADQAARRKGSAQASACKHCPQESGSRGAPGQGKTVRNLIGPRQRFHGFPPPCLQVCACESCPETLRVQMA